MTSAIGGISSLWPRSGGTIWNTLSRFAQVRPGFLNGGGHHANVHRGFPPAAQPPHSQILEDAQQLWQGGGHVAHLVQKQGAAVALLEATGRTLHGP
jgi:hypothetical protein